MKNKYVSGIRPSGKLHLGNYLGAIKHWKVLQEAGENTYFFVADMHGEHDINEVSGTIDALERCGIKGAAIQSWAMPELLELQHQLSHKINVAALIRKSHYYEKVDNGDKPSLALLAYPLLMACDILYHKGTHIIVGEDQRIHVEFARDIVDDNPDFGFVMPQAVINPVGARIMGLKDPTKKMSKSGNNPDDCIFLCDSADEIARKIKGATTSTSVLDPTPAAQNLREIYKALSGAVSVYHDKWSDFKKDLTDLLIQELGAK